MTIKLKSSIKIKEKSYYTLDASNVSALFRLIKSELPFLVNSSTVTYSTPSNIFTTSNYESFLSNIDLCKLLSITLSCCDDSNIVNVTFKHDSILVVITSNVFSLNEANYIITSILKKLKTNIKETVISSCNKKRYNKNKHNYYFSHYTLIKDCISIILDIAVFIKSFF